MNIKNKLNNKIDCLKNRKLKKMLINRYEKYLILDTTDEVVMDYKYTINKNSNDSYETCIKKLSRNFYSGEEISKNHEIRIIAYGNLYIYLDTNKRKIVDIKNYRAGDKELGFKSGYINKKLKKELDILYGIKDIKIEKSNKDKILGR